MSKHIKILLGGSPCTHWSIAQKKNRETEPSGMGWELFKNYLIAKEKFKPDFFLYENNKSAAQAIKDQIAKELGVGVDPKVRFTYINSALVSAQNRQRFYVTNFGDIEQPEDRGILLKDILEYRFDLSHTLERKQRPMVAEPIPVNTTPDGKARTVRATCYKDGIRNLVGNEVDKRTCVAEPVCVAQRGRYKDTGNRSTKGEGGTEQFYEARTDGKTNALTRVQKDNAVAKPVRVGCYPSPDGTLKNSQGMRLYSIEGKSVNLTANGGGMGGKTGLYAIPIEFVDDVPAKAVSCADGKTYPVYRVENGLITIKEKQYDIKLPDGFYIIRKLTVNECRRLQTVPDWYKMPCSASQNYKMLGNGWTIEVIKHILSHIPNIQNCTVEVLSMYDGMSCGQIALTELGCKIERYVSYEIDKCCIQTTQMNFPKTEQRGDAFQLRNTNWNY